MIRSLRFSRRAGPAISRVPSAFAAPVVAGALAALGTALDGRVALLSVGAALAIAIAVRAPGFALAMLLALVLAQDAIVDAGVDAMRYADEALLLAGLVGIVVHGAIGSKKAERSRASFARRGAVSAEPHPFARTPFDLPLLAFISIMLASAVWSGVPALVALLGMLALLKGPLAFELAARIPLRADAVRRVAGAIAVTTALAALIGVAQRVGGAPVFAITGRPGYFEIWQGVKAPGLFSHHNALGHVCVLGGVLALSLGLAAQEARRIVERRIMWVMAGLCMAGLIASASRESWIAAAVAALVMASIAPSRRAGARIRALAGAALLGVSLAVFGGLSYLGSPLLRTEMARRLAGVSGGWHDFGAGFTGWAFRGEYRVYAALKSLEVFSDHPWFGTGPGRFGGAVAQRFGSPVYEAYRFLPLDGVYEPLDLFWARLPAEVGLLGAIAYVVVFGCAFVVCARAGRTSRLSADGAMPNAKGQAFTRALGLGGVGAISAATVFAAFSPALEDPLVSIPIFLWAGVVWRLGRRGGASVPDGKKYSWPDQSIPGGRAVGDNA